MKIAGAKGVDLARSRLLLPANPLIALTLLLGTALRLWNYAGGRSLWLDETMVSLSLISLPLSSMFGELPFDQIAPVGWLLAEKAIFLVWPNADFGLRLLSIIGGVAALFVHWRLSRLTLTGGETLLSVALFAFASTLIRYSAMVKPYIWDALFAAAILTLAVRLVSRSDGRYRNTGFLGITGLACILFSFGALTVLASTGIVLFVHALTCRDRRWASSLVVVGLLWIATLGLLYLVVYKRQATLGSMVDVYWVGSFAPSPTSAHALAWYYRSPARVLQSLVTGVPAAILMIAVAIGAVATCRRVPWVGALLVGPFLAAVLASAIRAYPFDARLQLALAPASIVLLSYAVGTIATLTGRAAWFLPVLGIPLLSLSAAATAREALRKPPWAFEEIKPNLVRLRREAAPTDVVLVTPSAERALLVYASKLGLRGYRYRVTADHRLDPHCWGRGLGALPGRGRAWFVTYHERETWPNTRAVLVALQLRGAVSVAGSEPGSKLYRVDLLRQLPETSLPPDCYQLRKFSSSLETIAAHQGLQPLETNWHGNTSAKGSAPHAQR